MLSKSILTHLILALPSLRRHHAPGFPVYELLKHVARREVEGLFSVYEARAVPFPPFGDLTFPYHAMGSVDSLNLFDLDELILFSFYWINRRRYAHVLDVGANIGLHSILLARCGFKVRAYEPDPEHFSALRRNLERNCCSSVETFNVAVSSRAGMMEFVRVLGNTTGNHLAGSKAYVYGDVERCLVRVESIRDLLAWADLVKLDVEGHEREVLLATTAEDWLKTDAMVEVGSASNAAAIYEHFRALGVRLFAQKIGWRAVRKLDDMPTSYRDGSLFITHRKEMPWGGA